MIITRTPFRVTLGGGGTDLPSYYSQHGGFVFSAGLDKYMFMNILRPIVDDMVRVKYTKSETVEHVDQVHHEIARACLKHVGFETAIEIVSMADVPAGTGLGSSSCYTVGLLNALHTLKRDYVSLQQLAEEACHIELNLLAKPIGKQDQYLAAFGGLTVLEIDRGGHVNIRTARVERAVVDELERNTLLFYTGISRNAEQILADQSEASRRGDPAIVDQLHRIKDLGYQSLEAIESGNLGQFGLLLDQHWQSKKKLSAQIADERVHKLYDLGKQCGALGGKIAGAGGGGFFLFYIERGHEKLRHQMKQAGLREMRYRIEFEGTKVLANF